MIAKRELEASHKQQQKAKKEKNKLLELAGLSGQQLKLKNFPCILGSDTALSLKL